MKHSRLFCHPKALSEALQRQSTSSESLVTGTERHELGTNQSHWDHHGVRCTVVLWQHRYPSTRRPVAMDNVCGKLNKAVILIYADIANAELLMKELLTVMRSFHSILDLNNRWGFFNLFFFFLLCFNHPRPSWHLGWVGSEHSEILPTIC